MCCIRKTEVPKEKVKRYNRKLINRKFSVDPKAVYRDFKDNNI